MRILYNALCRYVRYYCYPQVSPIYEQGRWLRALCALIFIRIRVHWASLMPRQGDTHTHSVQFPIIGKYDVQEGFSDHGWPTPGEHSGGHHQVIEREDQEDCMFHEISTWFIYVSLHSIFLTLLKRILFLTVSCNWSTYISRKDTFYYWKKYLK